MQNISHSNTAYETTSQLSAATQVLCSELNRVLDILVESVSGVGCRWGRKAGWYRRGRRSHVGLTVALHRLYGSCTDT